MKANYKVTLLNFFEGVLTGPFNAKKKCVIT